MAVIYNLSHPNEGHEVTGVEKYCDKFLNVLHRMEKSLDSGQFAKVIPAPQYILGCLDRVI
ncbi:hypothetical protein NW769_008935 [Fusarium oxysporum]|nr:hypothetical protein NW769_008935 [Fusarium oxysporum]